MRRQHPTGVKINEEGLEEDTGEIMRTVYEYDIINSLKDEYELAQAVYGIDIPLNYQIIRDNIIRVKVEDNGDLVLDSIAAVMRNFPDSPLITTVNAFVLTAVGPNMDVYVRKRISIIYNKKEEFINGQAAREQKGDLENVDAFWDNYNEEVEDFKVVPQGRFVESIDLKILKDNRQRVRIGGAFLPYYFETKDEKYSFLFNRYDVYEKGHLDKHTNCFIVACQNSGLFSFEEIEYIKSQINDYYVNFCKLKPLCEKLKFTINLSYRTKHSQIKYINRGEKKILRLCLLKIDGFNHYILNEVIPLHNDEFNFCDSEKFIFKAIESGLMKKYDTNEILSLRYSLIEKFELSPPNACEMFSRLLEFKEKIDQETMLFFADLECIVSEEKHVPFCAIIKKQNGETKEFYGIGCEKKLMDYLVDQSKKYKTITYFHNLSYDGMFLGKYGIISSVEKGSRLYQEVIKYKNSFLTFKDSYALIPTALRNFSAMFDLGDDNEKEVYPYNHINRNNIFSSELEKVGEEEKPKWGDKEKKQFIDNCNKLGIVSNNKWDVEKYTKFYCRRDVEILHNGFIKFVEMCKNELNFNPVNYLSLSSMAYNYFKRESYKDENLFEYTGVMREYLRKAVYGGRCMTNSNKKYIIEEEIVDFDACSLYPSAMSRLFIPTGMPKKLDVDENTKQWLLNSTMSEEQIESTNERFISNYVVTIKIKKVNIKLDFPLIVKKVNGVNYNVNEDNIFMTVDNIYLEDLIKYHNIEYEIIEGVYWYGNKSIKLSQSIRKTYDLRNKYKREKNALQNIYKLLMNSSYGKSIQKSQLKENVFKRGEEELEKFWLNNYNNIIKTEKIFDSDIYRVELRKTLDEDYVPIIIGVLILSMSKRIMNELFSCADGIKIFYQDTDSIHIKKAELPILIENYKVMFNRELVGNELCQFHSDFPPIDKFSKDVFSERSIFLGKKAYIDCLVDQNSNRRDLVRMKGVPEKNIMGKSLNFGSCWDMYMKLYEGETLEFDLIEYGVHFKMYKSMQIESLNCFKRRVKFLDKIEQDDLMEKVNNIISESEEYTLYMQIGRNEEIENKIMKKLSNLNEKNQGSIIKNILFILMKYVLYQSRMKAVKIELLKNCLERDARFISETLLICANDVKNINESYFEDNDNIIDFYAEKRTDSFKINGESAISNAFEILKTTKEIIPYDIHYPNELALKYHDRMAHETSEE